MLKVHRYYFRLLFVLSLALSLLFSTTLSVRAANGYEFITNVGYTVSESVDLSYNDANTTMDLEYETTGERTSVYFYRVEELSKIFTTSTEYYAYKVLMMPASVTFYNNVFNNNSMVMWSRPVLGTYSDILNGDAQMGSGNTLVTTATTYSELSSFWIMSDHSNIDIYTGILIRGRQYVGTESEAGPFIDYDGYFTFSIYGYSEKDYLEEISGSIDKSNEIMQEQTDIANEHLQESQEQTEIQGGILEESQEQTEIQGGILEESQEQTETQKGILQQVTDFFGSFFQNLLDLIIGIFVPSSEEMSELFERLNQFFSDTFGFLYYPFDFLIRAFNVLMSSDSTDTSITLPGFSIMGHQVWSEQKYDIADNELVGPILAYVRIGTSVILGLAFLNYLRAFFEKRFGGGGQ